jgi:flagellar M-ring protein FliF
MNNFFKILFSKAGSLWAGWRPQQRAVIAVIAVVVLSGIIALFKVSASPSLYPVIDFPIREQETLDRIILRLNQEGVKVSVSANGLVQVHDEASARRMRTILIREDLIPVNIDPWQIFDRERWTITDMERNVNFQRAQTNLIIEHIKAIDDIDDVKVQIVWPKEQLFINDQNPASASVLVIPKPGSDITQNRKKIEGIQKLLKYTVEGLKDEFIVISDNKGLLLNDFENMAAFDRLGLIAQENKIILDMENKLRKQVLESLQLTFSPNRVRGLNLKIEMDMSKTTVNEKKVLPSIMKEQTPGLSYDDSIWLKSITIGESVSETKWKGTGHNPEGPGGVEGQAPPALKDMQNLYGEMTQSTVTHNEEISQRNSQIEKSPKIDRVTVSVNIDGRWKIKYNEKGEPVVLADGTIEREYTPVPQEDIRKTESLIRDAIGYNSARGDSVTVQNIPFDRTLEFQVEDEAYFRKKQIQTTVIVFLSGLTLLIFGFIVFRMVSREMERRRRLAEEERARREQMLRESAMAEAEQEGMDVSISLEERTRMELMESVINMAKEHPDDAAQLIRTWLLEE